ncbi:MAG TPA: M20 family metallopeptidase [Candidatus Dormibacteraeota bacterium]|nr:M20 family metallopeptidase [Candidatus Dormibacteraeota bacterium]
MKAPFPTPQALAVLKSRESAMARLLGRFVRAESPSFDKSAVDRFGRIVAAEWNRRGAAVTILRQRLRGDHIRAEWHPRGTRAKGQILVLGHLDTVYEMGTLARMPFRVSRGRAWGPGTFDMKGGLVIALYAVDALAAARCLPENRIVFLWTSDEEIGSQTSRALIEREARRSDAVIVLEPAAGLDGRVKTSRKGVGEFELAATGRAAHAGLNPEDGINAIEEIARQIARVSRWNQPRRGITVNAGVIEGGTRTNVIPEHARVTLDVRATRPADMRTLERRFRALRPILRGAHLKIHGGFNRPPMERSTSAALYAKARALAKEMGRTLGEARVGGGSDGNFTAALGVPTLDGLGAVGEGAHSTNENVIIHKLAERAALLAGLLATLGKSASPTP